MPKWSKKCVTLLKGYTSAQWPRKTNLPLILLKNAFTRTTAIYGTIVSLHLLSRGFSWRRCIMYFLWRNFEAFFAKHLWITSGSLCIYPACKSCFSNFARTLQHLPKTRTVAAVSNHDIVLDVAAHLWHCQLHCLSRPQSFTWEMFAFFRIAKSKYVGFSFAPSHLCLAKTFYWTNKKTQLIWSQH